MNRLQEINALNAQIQKKYIALKDKRTFTQSLTAGIAEGMAERAINHEREHDDMVVGLNEIMKNFP